MIDQKCSAAQRRLTDADRSMAGAGQQLAGLTRQVRVGLELHAAPRRPISTLRSRASSSA
jgi:hypothetical protein